MQSTRVQREQTYYSNRQPTNYYRPRTNTVVIYRDHYNDNFLMYMPPLWYYHHWDTIDHSRFQEDQIRDLQARMREYERQGVRRNPGYIEPGTDPDLMYSREVAYAPPVATQVQPTSASQSSGRGLGWLLLWALVTGVSVWGVWFVFIRRF